MPNTRFYPKSVKHHIEEEESELFPKLEGELDAEGLGTQMETRKQELQPTASQVLGREEC